MLRAGRPVRIEGAVPASVLARSRAACSKETCAAAGIERMEQHNATHAPTDFPNLTIPFLLLTGYRPVAYACDRPSASIGRKYWPV